MLIKTFILNLLSCTFTKNDYKIIINVQTEKMVEKLRLKLQVSAFLLSANCIILKQNNWMDK